MILPNNISVEVLSNSKKISNIICSVRLLTFHKNHYPLGMFKTNDKGVFNISKEEIDLKIEEANELFLMDYDDSPSNFMGTIEILVENIKDIIEQKNNIEKFFPEKAQEISTFLDVSINDRIRASFSKIFEIKELLTLDVSGYLQ
jgi:hypothetical protein